MDEEDSSSRKPYCINWKEAFLFFYCHVKHRRSADQCQIDNLLWVFLERIRPAMGDENPLCSWNRLLQRLMISLQVQMGLDSSVMEELARLDFDITKSWLYLAQIGAETPCIDWIRLSSIIRMSLRWPDAGSVDSLIRDVIVPAYRLETHNLNKCFDSRGIWESNPFLLAFEVKNSVFPWGVSLPFDISTPFEIHWTDERIIASKSGLGAEWTTKYAFNFGIVQAGKHMFILDLPQDTKLMNFRLFNLTKRYYTALILWSLDMERRNDPFLSPEAFLNDQFQAWRNQGTSVDDSFEVSHDLWLAMTLFEKDKSVPQPAPKFLALPSD